MKTSDQNKLYKHVDFLTKIFPYRNYHNLTSLKKASNYIFQKLRKYGYKPSSQKWEAKGNEYENIIASYQQEKNKRLILGAHYDVCGDQPGADDNASAVAGLLETARLFAENKPNIDYGVDFVAYCLEEPPFFATNLMGSYIHAKSLSENNIDVLGMVCFEMIGYFSDKEGSQSFPTQEMAEKYPSTANFIVVVGIEEFEVFNNEIYSKMAKDSQIDVQLAEFHSRNGLAGMSDQRNYWEFGYSALMINDTSFVRNPNYHLESDTIETLDFDKMSEVVNSCYRAISNLDL